MGLRQAWCVRGSSQQTRLNVKIVRGKLIHRMVKGDNPNRAIHSLHMMKEVLKRTSLGNASLEATLYAADLSPNVEHGGNNLLPGLRNPHPMLVYQKKTGDN